MGRWPSTYSRWESKGRQWQATGGGRVHAHRAASQTEAPSMGIRVPERPLVGDTDTFRSTSSVHGCDMNSQAHPQDRGERKRTSPLGEELG